MTEKIFKTLDEQIDILKGKGLVINDEAKARNILLREIFLRFYEKFRHVY